MEHKELLQRALTLLQWIVESDDWDNPYHEIWPQFHALINEIKEAVPEEQEP